MCSTYAVDNKLRTIRNSCVNTDAARRCRSSASVIAGRDAAAANRANSAGSRTSSTYIRMCTYQLNTCAVRYMYERVRVHVRMCARVHACGYMYIYTLMHVPLVRMRDIPLQHGGYDMSKLKGKHLRWCRHHVDVLLEDCGQHEDKPMDETRSPRGLQLTNQPCDQVAGLVECEEADVAGRDVLVARHEKLVHGCLYGTII
jgi:hypothetical protein